METYYSLMSYSVYAIMQKLNKHNLSQHLVPYLPEFLPQLQVIFYKK